MVTKYFSTQIVHGIFARSKNLKVSVNTFLRRVNQIILIVMAVYLVDMVLPSLEHEGIILNYYRPLEFGKYNTGRSREELIIDTSSGRIKIRPFRIYPIAYGDPITLWKSAILQRPTKIRYNKSGKHNFTGNFLSNWMVLLPLTIFGLAICSVLTKSDSTLRNLGSANLVLTFYMVYILFKDYLR